MEEHMEKPFEEPRIAINRVYTRAGDGGMTALAGGQRVEKDSPRVEAYGAVDELNAFIGLARGSAEGVPELAELAAILRRVQHELFNLGSVMATLPEDLHPRQARVGDADIAALEAAMDRMNAAVPALRSFVLPGGSRVAAELHVCRTVCRRAERAAVTLARENGGPPEAVRDLNRLGAALFVWSRWANHAAGAPETLWEPNLSSAALLHNKQKEEEQS
jgi:cob(I)alamin adenosyltransferase